MPVFDRNQPTVTVSVPVPTPVNGEPVLGVGAASPPANPTPVPAAPPAAPKPKPLHPSRRSLILPFYGV
jgi:hypothetical protein